MLYLPRLLCIQKGLFANSASKHRSSLSRSTEAENSLTCNLFLISSYFIILRKQRSIRLYTFCTHTLLDHPRSVAERNLKVSRVLGILLFQEVDTDAYVATGLENCDSTVLMTGCEPCHRFDNVMSHFIFTIQYHSMLLFMLDITMVPILKLRLD